MRTIAITNRKGGVGKTTVSAALAHGLALQGHRVLCIDMDSQCNLSQYFGIETSSALKDLLFSIRQAPKETAEKLLTAIIPVPNAEVKKGGALNILPGSQSLSSLEIELTGNDRASTLRKLLKCVESEYDYCIIDTPPSLGILFISSIGAAQDVIIPMVSDYFSLQGLTDQIKIISKLKKDINPELRMLGAILTCHEGRTTLEANIEKTLRAIAEQQGFFVFTPIPKTIQVKEAQVLHKSLFTHAPRSKATAAYKLFVKDVEKTSQERIEA